MALHLTREIKEASHEINEGNVINYLEDPVV